jgi:hypothetical protein
MIGYERHSETERVLVDNEELITQNRSKIQSFPLGDFGVQNYAVKINLL